MPMKNDNLSVDDSDSKASQVSCGTFPRRQFAILFLFVVVGLDALGRGESQKREWPASIFDASLAKTADGWSTDELLVRPDLRKKFLAEFSQTVESPVDERGVLLSLLRHRKAGRLTYRSERRYRDQRNLDQADSTRMAIEIAGRTVMDRHRITSDTLVCDPKLRAEFLEELVKVDAKGFIGEADALRSLMRLRKQRQLKPELVLQIADWDREVTTWSLDGLAEKLEADGFSKLPGIYLFRDASGYLYVGEAKNLATRLKTHLDSSDRLALLGHLENAEPGSISVEIHAFGDDSPASKVSVRRAYESELIRSRKPRLNIRP
ncbi:MAG: GIY-YIG nuclease family protein [Planctomycetota bacterium]